MKKNKQQSKDTLLDRIIRGHLYALIVLIPLLFWFDTQAIFTMPKIFILRTLSITAGFSILLKFCLTRKIKINLPAHSIFLGFWALSMILSTIFSVNQFTSIFGQYGRFMGLISLLNLLLIPFYVANFFRKEDLPKLLDFSIFTAVLAAIYGFMQYFNFFGLWSPNFPWTDAPQNRVFGTMGHANHLGAYLSAHFLMLLYRLDLRTEKRHPWQTWLYGLGKLISLMLMITVIMLTASRGAAIALVLAALCLIVLKVWKNRQQITKKVWRAVGVFAAVILILTGCVIAFSGALQDLSIFRRTEQTLQTIDKGITPDRLSFLYSSLQMFADNPLLGTGLSTFRDSYSAYRRPDYLIDGPGNAQYITVPESAHNLYADILSTQGIFGLLAYLTMIVYVFRQLFLQFREATPSQENYYLAIFGGLLVFLFQTLFNFGEIINLFLFYLLIGIALAEKIQPGPEVKKLARPFVYLTSAIAAIVLFLSFSYVVLPEAKADYYFQQANKAGANNDLDLANHFFQNVIAANSHEYQLFQAYGDFEMNYAFATNDLASRISILQSATNHYQQATQLNDHYPSTYHNLALAYIELFRLTKDAKYSDLSKQNYQIAVQKSPNNPRYLYEYARKLHSDWNDPEDSIKLLKQALQIAPAYQEPQDYLNFLYKNYPQLKTS